MLETPLIWHLSDLQGTAVDSKHQLSYAGWREQSVSSLSFFDPLERAAFFTGIKENN